MSSQEKLIIDLWKVISQNVAERHLNTTIILKISNLSLNKYIKKMGGKHEEEIGSYYLFQSRNKPKGAKLTYT